MNTSPAGDGAFHPKTGQRDGRQGYGYDVDYQLTSEGQAFIDEFGVTVPTERPVVRYCIDWSEQRHHLAGALGRGLRDRLTELGWIRRSKPTGPFNSLSPAGMASRTCSLSASNSPAEAPLS